MRIRRREDEREADDLRAEQRVRRHAVARLPEVLDQCELLVRIRPEQLAVHAQVTRRGVEVLAGERRIRLAQEDLRLHLAGGDGIRRERSAGERDLVDRGRRFPARHAVGAARRAVAGRDELPAGWRVDGERVGQELARLRAGELRVPQCAAREVDTLRLDDARCLREAPRVFLGAHGRRQVDEAVVHDMKAAAARGQHDAVGRDATAVRHRLARAVDAGECLVAGLAFEALQGGARAGDLEVGAEDEIDGLSRLSLGQRDLGIHLQAMGRRIDGRLQAVVGPLRVGGDRRAREREHRQRRHHRSCYHGAPSARGTSAPARSLPWQSVAPRGSQMRQRAAGGIITGHRRLMGGRQICVREKNNAKA